MAELKALLFDVDGTLADTEKDGHRVAFNVAFAEAGLDWDWSVELYGKLLAVNHRDADAQKELQRALELVAKADVTPAWLYEAHYYLARAMGGSKDAIPHWEEYLKQSPKDAPYRGEAKSKLADLGKPWEGQ